jgi:hypothetical protein
MENEFFLRGRKYKFFLWFHLIMSGLYLIFLLIIVWFYYRFTELADKSTCEPILLERQAEIYRNDCNLAFFYLAVNTILALIIKKRFKHTKEILNFYSIIILGFCFVNLIKGAISDIQSDTFNFFRLIGCIFFIIMVFYFYYLNIDKFRSKKRRPDNIDCIGTHNE